MKNYLYLTFIAIVIIACGRVKNEAKKSESQQRIVSISKQYNEIIYALGAEKNLVAVDVSSVYPAEIKELPTVGYHRELSLEAVLANKPDLILVDGPHTMGPEHVVTQLEKLKIPMHEFKTKATTIDSTKMLIKEIGTYFQKSDHVNSLCNKLDTDMKIALKAAKEYKHRPKVMVIHYGRSANVYRVMSTKSLAAKIVEWAGGEMAFNDVEAMRPISAEIVAQSDPDIILLTDFGYDKLGSIQNIAGLPGVSVTRAFKNKQVYRFEENDLVYFGPRTGENIFKMAKLIHHDEQVK